MIVIVEETQKFLLSNSGKPNQKNKYYKIFHFNKIRVG